MHTFGREIRLLGARGAPPDRCVAQSRTVLPVDSDTTLTASTGRGAVPTVSEHGATSSVVAVLSLTRTWPENRTTERSRPEDLASLGSRHSTLPEVFTENDARFAVCANRV
jgi:hypothetical protein